MMLPLVYIMLNAKPISIRRLCVLFVLSAAAAAVVLSFTHDRHVSTTALRVASTVAFAAWASPLIRIALAMRRRSAFREILGIVSPPVQASYGLALLLVPTMLVADLWARLHGTGLYLGEVSQALAMACVGVVVFVVASQVKALTTSTRVWQTTRPPAGRSITGRNVAS
jgi:hypothetical protein